MSGVKDSFGAPTLASQLRKEANEVNDRHDAAKLEEVYNETIKHAKTAAKYGNYTVKIYHDSLGDESIVGALQKKLSNDGFTCSKAQEDESYSINALKTMRFVTVSW